VIAADVHPEGLRGEVGGVGAAGNRERRRVMADDDNRPTSWFDLLYREFFLRDLIGKVVPGSFLLFALLVAGSNLEAVVPDCPRRHSVVGLDCRNRASVAVRFRRRGFGEGRCVALLPSGEERKGG
jgi:hypothetical protein